MKSKPTVSTEAVEISIVVPCYNEHGNIEVLYKAIAEHMKGESYEIVFVDDGSADSTLDDLQALAQKQPRVKYLSFSRNFGHQAALRAGLRYAAGKAVISMDGDMQHPPEMLPKLIAAWREGYEVVYTIRNDGIETGRFKRETSRYFYRAMNYLSDLKIDAGAADFRLLDRVVVDVINHQEESDLFLRGYISWLGFRQTGLPYTPAKRFSGQSKYPFRKMFRLATHGMTQFSIKPLRLSIIVGLVFAVLGALYGIYALFAYFTWNGLASGWTSLIIIILLTSGIQLMLLGIVGEYVGKTFLQTKQRPDYLVRRTNIDRI